MSPDPNAPVAAPAVAVQAVVAKVEAVAATAATTAAEGIIDAEVLTFHQWLATQGATTQAIVHGIVAVVSMFVGGIVSKYIGQ